MDDRSAPTPDSVTQVLHSLGLKDVSASFRQLADTFSGQTGHELPAEPDGSNDTQDDNDDDDDDDGGDQMTNRSWYGRRQSLLRSRGPSPLQRVSRFARCGVT